MNIYAGNLSSGVTEEDLRNAFEGFGQVTEVRLIMDKFSGQSKGFGFVEMPEKEEAEKAIEEMNGTEFQGRAITVNVAKPKASAPRRGGFGGGPRGRGGFGGGPRSGGISNQNRGPGGGNSRGGGPRGGGSGGRGGNSRGSRY